MSLLRVHQVSKRFGNQTAVDRLTFSVRAGQAYCLLGGNGAGKSTTVNLLLGFLRPDQGTLSFLDWDLWRDRAVARDHLFYLPDQVSLYPEFSALENLDYLTRLANKPSTAMAIREALDAVGLPRVAHGQPVGAYSKGMRQKVAIALARLKDAKLLLLDEPTSGLDPAAIKEFVALIADLKQGGAHVVMVTHDLQCAHLLADHIGILQAGVLVAERENRQLSLDDLEHLYFQSVLDQQESA
ncbi:ABC transporter ATP-binding protein [Acanthopleuribacter pedis]|uniref:ABC transporter ATP-binding protein n=1 Tax=Acanthopleuribacter pedis TaxID=442870 RepID=A0A8J7QGL7_9BACT|nr:ABC transporter ATP-binding protein [Acanthopleuribacter pedis]MBO1321930.1 ABC transporter ATP-binding protein [Acanthopleuribacter pedis]